jgi:geranylgeranyl pyrophosphate synthase
LKRVTRFGEYLGLAFQIADDILDVHGETAGRPSEGGRTERKKATYPKVVGIVQARERLGELVKLAVNELEPFGARAIALAALARHIAARALHDQP